MRSWIRAAMEFIREVGVSRFAVRGIAGVVVLAVLLGIAFGMDRVSIGKRVYTADFAQAGGIRAGDEVRAAGIRVGKVTDTELQPHSVRITLAVSPSVSLTTASSAEIKVATILGQRYIGIDVGPAGEPLDDDHIVHTRVPYDLQRAIEGAGPVVNGIDDETFRDSLASLNRQLAGAPAVSRVTIDALTEMSKTIGNRKDQITQLVADTRATTMLVDDRQETLAKAFGNASDLTQKLLARRHLVITMLDKVAELSREARAIAAADGGRTVDVVRNLTVIMGGLQKNRDNLEKLLQALPMAARTTNNALGDGPYVNVYLPWALFPDNWLCAVAIGDGCER